MELSMLKRMLLVTIVVSMVATVAAAQDRPGVEITLQGEYLWTSSLDATYGTTSGKFDIDDNPAAGFIIDVDVRPGTQLEFFYLRQKSSVTFQSFTQPKQALYDLTTTYYQIGAIQGYKRGKAMPFTGFTLGATSFDPEIQAETQWKFSVTLNVGVKVYINERIALRFHGRALSSFLDTGAGLWIGTGGVSMGLSGYGIWQWDLGGGLVILL
jgi:hypothetical protein